ncbi:MAG: phosphoenolpyruvate kinase [Acidimicrobiia bacterium]
MKTSLRKRMTSKLKQRVAAASAELAAKYPGESGRRQPVHTVYGGAHIFSSDSAAKLGARALEILEQYAPDAETLAEATGRDGDDPVAKTVYARVVDKLQREPVEDFRIDFEDGYGNRPDDEEDGHAAVAAEQVAKGMEAGTLPPFIGIRIKPFTPDLRDRAIRTLDLFITTLVRRTGRALLDNFVVTLPKVTGPEQVAVLAELLGQLEQRLRLPEGSLPLELMIETTQAIFDDEGRAGVPRLVRAAQGRCIAAHFGTYDYTASCNITAAHQEMTHPACDFARHVLQVSLAGTGVWLSDGATNIMPVPVHQAAEDGPGLTSEQEAENRAAVHAAWRLHYEHIRHSLIHAYYQGWDLNPAQLPTRYAAVYGFFLEGLDPAAERLSNFVEQAAQATLVGEVFDDAATGQGLLNFFLRAVNCGAVTEEEAVERTGLTLDELRSRSFLEVLHDRRG